MRVFDSQRKSACTAHALHRCAWQVQNFNDINAAVPRITRHMRLPAFRHALLDPYTWPPARKIAPEPTNLSVRAPRLFQVRIGLRGPQIAGYSPETGKRRFVSECVVVDAVPIEPASRVNSRLSGKRIGNSVNSRGRNPFASQQMPDVT